MKSRLLRSGIYLDSLFIAVIGVFFLLLKSYGLNPAVSDENIYFYDAWLTAKGFLPYRDFFFAHPPLHLLPGWLTVKAFGGFNLAAMKMLPVVASMLSAVFIYFLVKRAGGRVGAVAAVMLFLFSYDLLRASSHWSAVNWSVMWLCAALLAASGRRAALSGILVAFGISTGIYLIPGALLIAGMIGFSNLKNLLRYLYAASGTLLLINAPFLLIVPKAYLYDVFLYHFDKAPVAGNAFVSQLGILLFHNFFLLTAPLYFIPVLLLLIAKERRAQLRLSVGHLLSGLDTPQTITLGIWMILGWVLYLIFLSLLSRSFHYYFLLLFPFGAISAGLLAGSIAEGYKLRSQGSFQNIFFAVVVLLLLSGALFFPQIEKTLPYYQKSAGINVQYETPSSPLPGFLQQPLLGLFWNSERHIGDRYWGIQYYLWHESRRFDATQKIADTLKANASANDAIFGDSTSTPLVSLLSGVPIVDQYADTNTMRYGANEAKAEESVAELEKAMSRHEQQLNWVLINSRRGIAVNPVFQRFFRKEFELFRIFETPDFGTYILLKRKEDQPGMRQEN